MITVKQIDHLVLTVADIDRTVTFYEAILGMEKIVFGEDRVALSFGQQKINLHQTGKEFEPKAGNAKSGSADLCFIINQSVEHAIEHLHACHIDVIEGPVKRTGSQGNILSIYFRDPDENLIELSNYL